MADEAPTSTDPAASTRALGVAGARLPTSSPAEVATPKTSTSKIRGFVREARPRQWAKNVLVAAAPGAAGVLTHRDALIDTMIAFVAFCLAASGTYFLNDALDAEADRLHPKKRLRPIAAGVISVTTGKIWAGILIAAGIGIGFATGSWELPFVTAIYVLCTTSYSIWFKHVAVIDITLLASGFVLRAIAGAVATGVPISDWFFIVTAFGSLFMVTGKRHAEYQEMGDDRVGFRSTLGEYSISYLNYVLAVASGVTMVAYCLWAFEKTARTGGVPWYELSIVPFVLAMLRYALIVQQGGGGAPEDVVLGDRMLQGMIVGWVIVFGIAIYRG
ncbi:MAG: decaprenyl-phosphate phosphoribosyltransferase [Acidimicrobiia bacterium]